MIAGELGILVTPAGGKNRVIPGVPWAADNGCFTAGDTFDGGKFLQWLDAQPRENCLYAVAPDVVGDARATLARSEEWLGRIRAMGFPVAFVGQDGVEEMLDDLPWDDFDAWFTGGSTEWKLGTGASIAASEAKSRGKWLHMGRVNSHRRTQYAKSEGYDSIDGTFLAFGPDVNLPKLLKWMRFANNQCVLF
jgi:hypothetical protein